MFPAAERTLLLSSCDSMWVFPATLNYTPVPRPHGKSTWTTVNIGGSLAAEMHAALLIGTSVNPAPAVSHHMVDFLYRRREWQRKKRRVRWLKSPYCLECRVCCHGNRRETDLPLKAVPLHSKRLWNCTRVHIHAHFVLINQIEYLISACLQIPSQHKWCLYLWILAGVTKSRTYGCGRALTTRHHRLARALPG